MGLSAYIVTHTSVDDGLGMNKNKKNHVYVEEFLFIIGTRRSTVANEMRFSAKFGSKCVMKCRDFTVFVKISRNALIKQKKTQ